MVVTTNSLQTNLADQYNLISSSQFRDRVNFFILDSILIFVYDIHNLWNYSLVTFALNFDIKDYFDFVNYKYIFSKMKKYYILFETVK